MGLTGEEIPEFARVLAVADAFDSMTSTRSYRGARPVDEAIAELRKCAGTQFDPAFVEAFVAAIKREGWHSPIARSAGDPGWARGSEQSPPTARYYGEELSGLAGGSRGSSPRASSAQDHDDPGAPLRVIDSL